MSLPQHGQALAASRSFLPRGLSRPVPLFYVVLKGSGREFRDWYAAASEEEAVAQALSATPATDWSASSPRPGTRPMLPRCFPV